MNLKGMLGGKFESVRSEINVESIFPDPIFIRLPNATMGNLNGILINHREVFGSINDANTVSLMTHNDQVLAKVGDVESLRKAIFVLMPPNLTKQPQRAGP